MSRNWMLPGWFGRTRRKERNKQTSWISDHVSLQSSLEKMDENHRGVRADSTWQRELPLKIRGDGLNIKCLLCCFCRWTFPCTYWTVALAQMLDYPSPQHHINTNCLVNYRRDLVIIFCICLKLALHLRASSPKRIWRGSNILNLDCSLYFKSSDSVP